VRSVLSRLRHSYDAAPLPVKALILIACCALCVPFAGIALLGMLVFAPYAVWTGRRDGWATVSVALWGLVLVATQAHGAAAPHYALLVLPVVAFLRRLSVRRRIALLAIAAGATMATVAPWVTYNLTRFEHPVFLSIPDATLLAGNCHDTYYGTFIGYWSVPCVLRLNLNSGDRSSAAVVYRREARRFIGQNLGRVPFVVFAREGRTWGFYHPDEQLQLDRLATKELELSRLGLGIYYFLAAGTIAAAVILRRRRVPVFPLLAIVLTPALSVAVTIGETRYRALAEVALVLGGAVTIDAVISRLRRRRRSKSEGAALGPLAGDGDTPGAPPPTARMPAKVGPPGTS